MNHLLIDQEKSLEELCERLSQQTVVGIDTEFVRTSTYYPRLCLIQIAAGDRIDCIDALALGSAWSPLAALLTNPKVIKVMHAGRQDIEVLFHTTGVIPVSLFDTQIAAGLLGHHNQTSYAGLVKNIFDTSLPKSAQRTDWAKRPLSAAQIDYARNDVRYMVPLYERLSARLLTAKRGHWVREDCDWLCDVDLYCNDPETAYLRVGKGVYLKPDAQHTLKNLCAWREREAQSRNRPRHWVMDDEALIVIAQQRPTSMDQLSGLNGISTKIAKRYGERLIEIVQSEIAVQGPLWKRESRLSNDQLKLKERLMKLLKNEANRLNISESILASRSELNRLVRGSRNLSVTRGWRRSVIGQSLLEEVDQCLGRA